MILALALVLFAQTPGAAPPIEDLTERRAFDAAQTALQADEGLLGLHRGFRAYLWADDELRQAEENYDALMQVPTLRERVEDFEEVLSVDADARGDFRRYLERAQRDPALREAVEAIRALELEPRPGADELSRSFAYLRAHPRDAISFLLRRDARSAAVQDLRPLQNAIRRDGLFHTRLREAWTKLDGLAGAREAVYPWWARVFGGGSSAGLRYRALESEFARRSTLRRVWEAREIAWASQPEATAWRDHLYARARRDPALGANYFDYLRTLRTRPEVAEYVDEVFAAKHGPPPAWPPQGTPPRLEAWRRPESVARPGEPEEPALPSFDQPGIVRPEKPTINQPTAPTRPVAPERARQPGAP